MTPRKARQPDPYNNYRPPPGTALLTCTICGAHFLDDGPPRRSHAAVFGHQPRAARARRKQSEGTPDGTTT